MSRSGGSTPTGTGTTLPPAIVGMIKCTAPAFKQNGEVIVNKFFEILFTRYPVFKNIFVAENIKSGKQVKGMADAWHQFAVSCDNLSFMEDTLSFVVGRHVNLNVEAWHYPLVGECLSEAISTVLKDETTPEIIASWDQGYTFLSKHMIKLETEFRKNPYFESWKLTEETIKVLKSTAPDIKTKGTVIASRLFEHLFDRYPVFRSIFPKDNATKGKMLAVLPTALYNFAEHCDNVSVLTDTVSRIANRHVDRGVQDWHYPLLCEALMEAIKTTLACEGNPKIEEAWRAGYKFLANKIRKVEKLRRNQPLITESMTDSTVNILKTHSSLIKTSGVDIINHFYKILFARYPLFKNMFKEENVKSGKQVNAMAAVILEFAENADNFSALDEKISHIVGHHVGREYGVEPWHYTIVGHCLIEAISTILGKDASPQFMAAWKEGYSFLSSTFIQMEEEFRQNPYYKNWSISDEGIAALKSTAPMIKQKGTAIASRLYGILFQRYPVFKEIFPKENAAQGKMVAALPHALYTFAQNCTNIGPMKDIIARVAQTHVSTGVNDWHYPMMEDSMLEALKLILGQEATPAMLAGWSEGFKFLANQIMKKEDLIRQQSGL